MKKLNKTILLSVASLLLSVGAFAQDCAGYYPVKEGAVLAYRNSDDKGKVTSTTKQTILSKTSIPQGVNYAVKSEVWDAKDKLVTEGTLNMRCEGGVFYIDMKNFLDPSSMAGMKDAQIEVSGVDMEIPAKLAVGQSLPDANITMSIGFMKIMMNITNRKVVAAESITVPAGTFDCLKITYDFEAKALFKMTGASAQWMAKGPGIVKSETYDKKGKLSGSQVLTEYKH